MSYIPSIDVHFAQFKTSVDKLKDLVLQLENISNGGLEKYMLELKGVWNDEGTNLFSLKMNDIRGTLQTQAQGMKNVVDEIEKEALVTFDAELFSRGLAFSRCY